MNYYDVKYLTPGGNVGTAMCINAYNEKQASFEAQNRLCASTPYLPEDFKIIQVIQSPDSNFSKENI